ncbi:hypothetical protein DES53_102307 [Roseimicrobium gellanilyticum]|uniref:Uncharacterized protein n=1 Tax=Roseimicrobium gellanilyticum TaxID=748857 RepID=A0A366HSN6_9BACT|nr:hypothetical protein [Roseimicrobium gellanilyticum]RBP45923.1 hypothetical protein DES53_102307 [Roseimicrobium gellanilyticum]
MLFNAGKTCVCKATKELMQKAFLKEGGETFTKAATNTVRDLFKTKPGQSTYPPKIPVELSPRVSSTLTQTPPLRRTLTQVALTESRTRSRTLMSADDMFKHGAPKFYSTTSGSDGGEGQKFPSSQRQGRLDALDFLKDSFPAPKKGEEILLGHIVKRGIEQFAQSLPERMQDVASGSIGKHYREDVGGLMKLPGSDQNRALLACVETVQWNQEAQRTGQALGASMSAADRFSILTQGKNLDNLPPGFHQGMAAALTGSWEPISKTASLTPEQRKIFEAVSNEVTVMAASLSKDGVVNVKQLGDAVTKCAELSENDPTKLLKLLKEKNDALKLEQPDKNLSLENAQNMKLNSGYTLGSAIGKPREAQGPSVGTRVQ